MMYLMNTAISNPPPSISVTEYKGQKLAITICEDLWNISDAPLYVRNPMEELSALEPDLIH